VVGAELRITCAKDELAQALGVVARALSTRSSVQILSGILLEARDGDL
jgi:DNA polymerase III sliding clamp (beta) subunit (PCNA family)